MRKAEIGRWRNTENHLPISLYPPIPSKVVEVEVSRRYHPAGPVLMRVCGVVVEWKSGGRRPPSFWMVDQLCRASGADSPRENAVCYYRIRTYHQLSTNSTKSFLF
jgi:hypothetical protein